ncbi:RtcB family protein [Candidatus Woesearchaeota archaeon]|uniref:RtcB family protein n=1 Tax=uncultured Arcobacter sp. TaxID=165434 RepID=UPI000CB34382|nr:RtcB family protein [uncultured Arcobacter sp.]PLW79933.1 MAG: RtcB family protein [Candidatus Woesearchaeota archaeon]
MMKKIKIYAEILEDEALEQFNTAMCLPCNISGALMPDAHTGYTLPIGAVIKSDKMIFPAYVGYDIGCGMCAVKLDITSKELDLHAIKEAILRDIPIGHHKQQEAQSCDDLPPCTDFAKTVLDSIGKFQLGTLGGGNHFIELGVGSDKKLWIVIHSGSRGFGKIIAEHYMKLACAKSIDTSELGNQFEVKNSNFKEHNPQKFEDAKAKFLQKELEKHLKTNLEGHYGFSIDSSEGLEYIKDMNCALEFALKNRKKMIEKIKNILGNLKELLFINKNHNHAIIDEDGFVLHRKGATGAETGEYGVIPGNMKDGSFVVIGKGCEDSLCSSSHGAGRVLSRMQAKKTLSLDEFHNDMVNIITNHSDETIDEAPKAYKNIFEVMELQKDLVDVVEHIRPILNIKG